MLKERSQSFKALFVLSDFFVVVLSFGISYYIRYYLLSDSDFQRQVILPVNYFYLAIILGISQTLSFLSIDLYHPRRGLSVLEELFGIFSGIIINLIIILALLFFFRGESFSRLVILLFAGVSFLAICLTHAVIRNILWVLRKKGYNLRSVIVLGTGKAALGFANAIQKHSIYGYSIRGFLYGKKKLDLPLQTSSVLGEIEKLESIIKEQKIDLIVYALSHEEGDYLKESIDVADFFGIDIKVVPSYQEFITAKGRVEVLDGIPIISIRNIPLRLGYNRLVKRAFDLCFSSVFLLFFFPFFIVIALLIKFTSRGPIFHKQERVGLDNKSFWMLKFRTMVVQEKQESATKWTTKDDPRVTKIGGILRKLSLDELPQFFNVFLGDMSVVGPRPERPFFVEKFQSLHEHYMRRHAVKAGITGWAQINGWRGDTSIEKRVEADIFYIENWSLFLDLKIIFLTPWKALFDRNAY